jgi:hypothetical protein
MKGVWSSLALALVAAVIILAFLFFIVLKTVPAISNGINNIIKGVMKPICCNWLNCKPGLQEAGQSLTNPGGGIACTAICYGVCD